MNAGIHLAKRFSSVTDEEWQRVLAVNLNGIFYFTQAVLPDMEAANWGRIINMASVAGRMGVPFAVPYNTTKHGVIGFTRGLALDLARTGITVNAICPGWVRTDMVRANAEGLAAKKGVTYEQALAGLISTSPQQRLVEPEEVAHVAVMLLSDSARSINCGGVRKGLRWIFYLINFKWLTSDGGLVFDYPGRNSWQQAISSISKTLTTLSVVNELSLLLTVFPKSKL